MNVVKINGKEFEYPSNWNEITFKQFCEIERAEKKGIQLNDSFLLAIILGAKHSEIREWQDIDSYNKVLKDLNGFTKTPDWSIEVPKKIKYKGKEIEVLQQLGKLSVGQFEDMKLVLFNNMNDGVVALDLWGLIVAIWLYPEATDKEYNFDDASKFKDEVINMSAFEVMTIGNFFLDKLMNSLNGTIKDYRPKARMKSRTHLMMLVIITEACLLIGAILTLLHNL